jgi:hypothetical protein
LQKPAILEVCHNSQDMSQLPDDLSKNLFFMLL